MNTRAKATLYDANLKPVLEVCEKDWVDKTKNGKGRKRGVSYIEDPSKRSDSRCRRRKGAMTQLTTTTLLTHDDCYFEFHNSHDSSITRYSTSQEIMRKKLESGSTTHPTVNNNFFISPFSSPPFPTPSPPTPSPTTTPITVPCINSTTVATPPKTFTELLNCDDVDLLLQATTPTSRQQSIQIDAKNLNSCQDQYKLDEWIGCDVKNCNYWTHQLCI